MAMQLYGLYAMICNHSPATMILVVKQALDLVVFKFQLCNLLTI